MTLYGTNLACYCVRFVYFYWKCDRNMAKWTRETQKNARIFLSTATHVEVSTLFDIMITKWLCNRIDFGAVFFLDAFNQLYMINERMHFECGNVQSLWICVFRINSGISMLISSWAMDFAHFHVVDSFESMFSEWWSIRNENTDVLFTACLFFRWTNEK